MKNEGTRGVKNIIQLYFWCSFTAASVVGGRVWSIIKLIQDFRGLHVTCKNEEDPFKNKMLEWTQKISHCKSMQILSLLRAVNSTVWWLVLL